MSQYVTFEDLVRFHKEVIAPDLDARMDARMAQLATKSDIDAVRYEIGGVRDEIGGVRDEVDGVRYEIGGVRNDIDGIRDEIGGVRDEIDAVRTLVAGVAVSLQGSMEAGFRDVQETIDHRHRDVLGHFDRVYNDLDALSVEYTAIKGGLRRVEKRLSKLDGSTN